MRIEAKASPLEAVFPTFFQGRAGYQVLRFQNLNPEDQAVQGKTET